MSCLSKCPGNLCDCDRSSHNPQRVEMAQSLKIKKNLDELLADITNSQSASKFTAVREKIRQEYGVIFLIKGTGDIIVDITPGLCRLTRNKIRTVLKAYFITNHGLLLEVLEGDSLFMPSSEVE